MDEVRPEQLRAARVLLGWSRERLAAAANTTEATVSRIEAAAASANETTLPALRSALEAAGVEFMTGEAPGVRLRAPGQPMPASSATHTPFREVGPESEVRGGPEAPEA